jgi:hypothetical protein
VCLGAILKMYPGMLSAQLLGRLLPEIEKSSNIRDPCLSPSPRTVSRLVSAFDRGQLVAFDSFLHLDTLTPIDIRQLLTFRDSRFL